MMNQIVLFVGLGVLVLVFLLGMLAKMYRKAGPNEAIIVYGYHGPASSPGTAW